VDQPQQQGWLGVNRRHTVMYAFHCDNSVAGVPIRLRKVMCVSNGCCHSCYCGDSRACKGKGGWGFCAADAVFKL
jgi:hypothetical protein